MKIMATTNPYSFHLLASLKSEAEKVAAAEGTTLDQFINAAVAEKPVNLIREELAQDVLCGRKDLRESAQLFAGCVGVNSSSEQGCERIGLHKMLDIHPFQTSS